MAAVDTLDPDENPSITTDDGGMVIDRRVAALLVVLFVVTYLLHGGIN